MKATEIYKYAVLPNLKKPSKSMYEKPIRITEKLK